MDTTVEAMLGANDLLRESGVTAKETQLVSLCRGQTINDQYGGTPQVCLVVKGTISVFSRSEDGHEVLLTVQKQGDLFGVSNLFLKHSLETTLRSKTNATLLLVPKETLRTHLEADMHAMLAYARFCNEKILFLLGRLEALTPRSARSRLIAHLLATSKDCVAAIPNKDALAKSLGIGRSSLYRELAHLECARMITAKDAKTYLVDTAVLQAALSDFD
ncbi:MAG: Crp/Fnr family transcriptional regulator [Sphaerochaeta sp.]|jgi:CRP-like cAMP-binding protein|nr:Crp/Fnr family transcriptional regulator [Sphaerochaeta sp.]